MKRNQRPVSSRFNKTHKQQRSQHDQQTASRIVAKYEGVAAHGPGPRVAPPLRTLNQDQTQTRLQSALKSGTIALYAQEIAPLDATSPGHGLRFEVLMRMRDAHGRLWDPAEAFEIAEHEGVTSLLDRRVLQTALRALLQAREQLDKVDFCSINLSAASICGSGMREAMISAINASGVPPSKLCFEITETSELKNHPETWSALNALRAIGCRIAIDDFGSGYANFLTLNRGFFDLVKIDGAFTRGLLSDPALRADFTGLLQSARVRALPVVAEFVEDNETLQVLNLLGVEFGQGYYLHRPEPVESFIASRLGSPYTLESIHGQSSAG